MTVLILSLYTPLPRGEAYAHIWLVHVNTWLILLAGWGMVNHKVMGAGLWAYWVTCDWLQKGRSHPHTEPSPVPRPRCTAHGPTRGLRMPFSNKRLFRPIYLQVRLALQEMHGFLFVWVPHVSLQVVWFCLPTVLNLHVGCAQALTRCGELIVLQ